MPRKRNEVPFRRDPLKEFSDVIARTNVTGLAGRGDYELAFGAVAGEQREWWIASATFLVALRGLSVDIGRAGVVAAFRPGEPLPADTIEDLEMVNAIVDATPTQVLHAREQGGVLAEAFGVHQRMECGILMVILGDTQGSRVRAAAWRPDGEGGWALSRSAFMAARRYGLSEAEYVQWASGPEVFGVLPHVDSAEVGAARAKDAARGLTMAGVWISFSAMAELATPPAS